MHMGLRNFSGKTLIIRATTLERKHYEITGILKNGVISITRKRRLYLFYGSPCDYTPDWESVGRQVVS